MTEGKAALLLIDFQNDFLRHPRMGPHAGGVIRVAGEVLEACRRLGVPVIHVHTVTDPDGSNRMPHWRGRQDHCCVAGSEGALPPATLAPQDGEPVIEKQFFSGFQGAALDTALGATGAETLLVAGLYSHGCVRATVLDAYARGYEVVVIEDAIASPDHEHARCSNDWLRSRAARFAPAAEVLATLRAEGPGKR